ncbi:hypothetical protein [Winogradskyella flava]|uniref:Uncharacterized protein n=1 Tax=Winogradskyella flava TaxID=1884876 RepID=A0A842IUI6_9FLAO|nr:hypothetical protein [Winogradskyella flava]MBC2845393.1 hypothetical protein [Winogradskyella flava]
MQLKRTNLEEKLNRIKAREKSQQSILDTVREILAEDDKKDEVILETISSHNTGNSNDFDFDLLESDKIYHIDQIKKICVTYRLRFLDTKFFKGELPYEAISKIKQLEKSHDIRLDGFKIMAPAKLFKLENYDDPLLFAPIGNGYYYLIHKWGNDLSPYRKLLMWPFKTFENFVFCTFILSILLTGLIPDGTFSDQKTSANAGIIFLFMFKSVFIVAMYYGYLAGKNFSSAIWDSKYYNA